MPDIKSLPMLEFGSLNLLDDDFTMPIQDFKEMLYWYHEKRNSLKKCLGYAKVNSSGISSNPIHGLQRLFIGSTGYLMEADSTTVKYWSGATPTGAPTSLETGLTSNSETFWAASRGYIFRQNGTDAPQMWDGTNLTTVGITAPSFPPITEEYAEGHLNGTFEYKITYASAVCESNGSPASIPITVSNKTVKVTIPVSSDSKVTKRKLYRTQDSGATFFYLTTIEDNTSTAFYDTGYADWTVKYEGDFVPDSATPSWTHAGSDNGTVSGGILTIDTGAGILEGGVNDCSYMRTSAADPSLSSFKIKCKIKEAGPSLGGGTGLSIILSTSKQGIGAKDAYVWILLTTSSIYQEDGDGTYTERKTIDLDDDYHEIRVDLIATASATAKFLLFVDDVLEYEGTSNMTAAHEKIQFGDLSTVNDENVNADIDYLHYAESGLGGVENYLDTTIQCPIHNEPMPTGKDLCLHKSRMFTIDQDTIYWSGVNQPWHYDTVEFREQPGRDDGTDIMRILPLGDSVVVYKENSIYLMQELSAQDSGGGLEYQEYYANQIEKSIGLASLRGLIDIGEGRHIFVSSDGIYMLTAGEYNAQLVSQTISPLFNYTDNPTIAVNPDYISECALGYNKGILYFSYPEGSGATTADAVIAHNFITGEWFKPPTPATRIFARFFEHGDETRIYCGDSASTGFVYRLNYGENAAGSDFKAILETKKIGDKELQSPGGIYNFHSLILNAESDTTSGILDVFYKREWDSSWKRLGKFTPKNYPQRQKKLKFRNCWSPSLQLRIECDGQESDVTLKALALKYSLKDMI